MKSIQFFAVAALSAAALSPAAYAAPASFANNGEIGAPVLSSASTADRAAVRAQGIEAARAGQIATGDHTVATTRAPATALDRADVRAQAQQALHAGQIATGDVTVM